MAKDYFNLSVGTAHIAMLKVPATARPTERLGTIVSEPHGGARADPRRYLPQGADR